MDYDNYQNRQSGNGSIPPGSSPRYRAPVPYTKPNGFATAALVLGIIAFLSAFTMTILPPLIFGSLTIILGILSRGDQKRMHSRALAGVIAGAAALVLNLAICFFSFYIVFSDPETTQQYWDMVNETYEQMLGASLEEILETYGISMDGIGN